MKTKNQLTNRILSLVLALVMVLGMLPMSSLTAFAASTPPEYNDSSYLDSTLRPAVFANGNDLIIEAGSTGGTTSVYYMSGGTKTAVVENADLSNAYIIAGYDSSAASMSDNVTITMHSGKVNRIFAGHRYGGTINGDITIIMMEDANVQGVNPYSVDGNTTINGKLRLFAANGLSGATVAYRSFDGQIVKTSSGWNVTGDAFVPSGCTMEIEEGTTATVASGATITNNGNIVNNGTIHLQKSFTQLKGTEPTGSGTYIVNLPYVANASAATDVSVDCIAVTSPVYKALGGKLYLDVSQGKVWAKIDGAEYYCDFNGEQTEMQSYTSVTDITVVPVSMDARTSDILTASVSPDNVLPQRFIYQTVDAGTTGASLTGASVTVPFGGTAELCVTATDGYRNFTMNFEISVNQVAVTGIANDSVIPANAEPSSITLPTQALPADATYKTIEWTVDGPATLSGNTLKLSGTGTVTLTATVKNGLGNGQDYVKTYIIAVSAPSALNVSNGDIYIQKAESGHTVQYVNESGQQQNQFYAADQLIVITGTTTEYGVTIVSGSPKLVLKNCSIQLQNYQAINMYSSSVIAAEITLEGQNTLKAAWGIYVPSNTTLTIDGNGSLSVTGLSRPGIGGGNGAGTGIIIINGGTVNATGSDDNAGIGGDYSDNTEIIINSGNVTATGGDRAAGIGGGYSDASTVTINGGTVTANGGKHGAGIGGGENGACNVTINGGEVTATGGDLAAGIGGGYKGVGTVIISAGEVSATGGEDGAGIGGGYYGVGTVTITGGSVTARAGTSTSYNGAAGIGGGYDGAGTVTINGGTVSATGNMCGAGIGGSYQGQGNVVISGGRVTAYGGEYDAPGIGGGSHNSSGTVDISGGTIEAVSNSTADGVESGTVTITGGSLLAKNTYTSHVQNATNGAGNGSQTLTVKELTIDQLTGDMAINSVAGVPSYYSLNDVQTMGKKLYLYLPGNYPESITVESGDTYYHAGDGLYSNHMHSWSYSANDTDDRISAVCTNTDGCLNTDGGSVRLNVADAYYTGGEIGAAVTGSFTNGATYTITYNGGSEIAPNSIGTHTAKLTVYENGTEKQSVTAEYTISYLDAPSDAYSISGGNQIGTSYWFQTDASVTVYASADFEVSKVLDGDYAQSVSFSQNEEKTVYLKRISDSALTDAISIEGIRYDGTAATGKITVENRGYWQTLLNKITFGLFFKDDTIATVTANDTDSGIRSIQYYVANVDLINNAALTDMEAVSALDAAIGVGWSNYNNEIALNKNAKNVVYVKITDNVGNVTYLSSEGIVLYSDAQAVTESVSATYKAGADKDVTVALNGNTVKSVANGAAVLTAGTDYTVSADGKITLKAAYLDTLSIGIYTFTMSYNPFGETYVDAAVNEAPATTTFKVVIEKADGEVSNINMTGKTYDGTAVTAPSFDRLGDGEATVEYKVKGAEDSTYTTTAPKNAGNYVVRVTVAEGTNHKAASATAEFSITPAEIKGAVVTLDQKTFVYDGQPHKPTATVAFNGVTLTADVDYELYYLSSEQIMKWNNGEPEKFFGTGKENCDSINAGQYYAIVFGKGNFADNGKFAYAAYAIEKAAVTEPTIASKPFTNSAQKADISDTDLYAVVQNNGGTAKGSYDVVLRLNDSANYKWSTTNEAQVTLQFVISAAQNAWDTAPAISGWTYGEAASVPTYEAKHGTVKVVYTGTANDGSNYISETAPTKAGNYTATFTVAGTEDYSGLSESVNFTIAKANYDMSLAKWDYTNAFKYDGKAHKVAVEGLPAGVTVVGYENNTATAVGDYYAKVTLAYDTDNYNAPAINVLGWTVYNDWTPAEYTVNGNGWMNKDFVISAKAGYKVSLTNAADGAWKDALIYSAETADGILTFYLKNETDGTISLAKTISYKIDKTAPTGKVAFAERTAWEEFLNTITFGLFYKDEVTVRVTANDNLSGVAKIEHASLDKAMTLDQVKEIANWTEYNGSFGVTLEDAKKFVYFVRITDNAGNVTYLSTNGAEYDTTTPVISGVENGRTYYTTQKVTVTEKNVDTITLNSNPATENITLEGNKEATYTIVVTDKAGNSTTVTVTMKPIKDLAKATENLSNDNVTSEDEQALNDLVAKLDELLADPDVSEDGEKETLEQHKVVAESLLKTIDDTKAENDRISDAIDGYGLASVTSEDKDDLVQLLDDIEKQLASTNLTDKEISELNGDKKSVEDLLAKIKGTDELIDKLTDDVDGYNDDTVKSTDKDAIKQIAEDIANLLETGNLTEDEKKTLTDVREKAEGLLDTIEAAAKATETENTEKVVNVTAENVTPEEKTDLEKAKEEFEKALEDNGGNYTDDEKKAIEGEIKRIDDALEVIGNVEAVEESISKLPAVDTVKPDDKEAIKAITDAQTAYNALSDYEKSLVDEATKANLDKLVAALVAYDIVEGDGSAWTEDSDHNITFVVNGLFSKFEGIQVDGVDVDKANYEAKAGSTIITLKESYLDTLKVGEHTITVVYTDGCTDGSFEITAKSITPATGDAFSLALCSALIAVSLTALVVLFLVVRKRMYA